MDRFEAFESLEATEPETDFLDLEHETEVPVTYDEPDSDLIVERKQTARAARYSKKIKQPLQKWFRVAVANPATVPDSAALVMYSDNVALTWGNLADADAKVAKAIDWITEGSENPYLAAMAATLPLVMQLVRNHEPVFEPQVRGIRIPFTKRHFKVKFGIKLTGFTREALTHDPGALTEYVYSKPSVVEKLRRAKITIARNESRGRRSE